MSKRRTVLVADDDPTTRSMLGAAVRAVDMDVLEVADGHAALEGFERNAPDFLILDIDMPGPSGLEVSARLRETAGPLLPIVIATGFDDVKSIEAAYRAGATDFISKPFNWALVGHRVRYLMRAYETGLALQSTKTKLRAIEAALLDASRREQRALAHELHDGLGQELTGLSMLAAALGSAARRGQLPTPKALDDLAMIASRSVQTCRAISRGLSPLVEIHGGLVEALKGMVERQRQSYDIEVRLQVLDDAPLLLPLEVQDNLFRIAQEAVTNACKHAHASCIRLLLAVDARGVRLEIHDDGRGIAPGAEESGGIGLITMQYRASNIGAQLLMGPGPDGGTRVICRCPQ